MNAVISFCNFGKQRIETSLSRQLSEEISKHNTRVHHNRSIFQRLVDIVCHLAQQELPFRGHDESKTSLNKGNFLELVSLLSKYDPVLDKHMQQQDSGKPGPSYLSNKIQNDIIHSVADVLKSRIEFEIKITKFVSIIIDETPDVSNRAQLCLILRYYFANDVHDRFLGFVNISEIRELKAENLSKIILELLNNYNCTEKLVAQSYEGASVMSWLRIGVQQKIKEVCPQAIYIWCNAYILNWVLSKSCGRIAEVSSFFSALQALIRFFSNSTKRAAFYDKHCNKKLPHTCATRWTSCIVNTVFEQKNYLIDLFTDISDNPHEWDGDTILAADNFYNLFKSFNFNFFLSIFHAVFEKTDCLYNIIKKSQVDVGYCSNKIEDFQSWLRTELHSQFDHIYENTLRNNSAPRLRRNITCARMEYKRLFIQIIDTISYEINDSYSDILKLQFFHLLNNKLFDKYRSDFPSEALDSLLSIYANHFDKETLKNQLICLYTSPELQERNAFDLIDFINENSLEDAFPQLLKLAHLLVTIPATSSSAERAFSSLKRIHTYLRNTQDQERLSDLSMIAIEKQLLVELKCSPTFYSDVIKAFLQKDSRFDLEYK
ncbi:unnamed protein product [Euphydryas editha]|uniref:Zinc finger MYM-type protein 1-like n=1 Tax=Euphydryas editha TaxID=104508 RepID=A0AAU9UP48_EUPED|nr:unnamed protein product [Euphydryas editha]